MTTINNNYSHNYYYEPVSKETKEFAFLVASVATGLVYKALPSFSNPFLKQMTKEHQNNHLYKDVFERAVEISGLKRLGLKIIDERNPGTDIGRGLNACFIPSNKEIRINKDLASITGFHELGHAINNMKGGFGKVLQKLRGPGMAIAGIMGSISLASRGIPKDDKRDLTDFLQDNCGKIAFASLLPVVAEESLASYRGIKLAKQAGLDKSIIPNLKNFYSKALLSYGGYALVTGVAVYLGGKIMEIFTRPKKIEIEN